MNIPDPKCVHSQRKESVLVSSHPDLMAAFERGDAHASVRVCGRDACIEDAVRWLYAQRFDAWVKRPDATWTKASA